MKEVTQAIKIILDKMPCFEDNVKRYNDILTLVEGWSIRSDSVGLCSWCGGSGQLEKTNYQGEYPQKYDCHVCNGTGKEPIKSDKGGKNE